MAIEPLAVWSIPPDWRDGVAETLDWLTAVTASPLAVEQRLGLRLSPRQSFELSYTVYGPVRTFFDLLVTKAGGSPVYLPLWHEIERLTATAAPAATSLALSTDYTEFTTAQYAFIRGANPFTYEVVEIDSVSPTAIGLAAPLVSGWPAGTRVYPLKKCKLEGQPTSGKRADKAAVSRVRFTSLEPNKSTAVLPTATFLTQLVLEQDPNEAEELSYTYERAMFNLDNRVGVQHLYDVSGFTGQQFSWLAKGRQAQSSLRGLFYALDGRRVPIWVPTIYADFELTAPVADISGVLDVKRCGFVEMGGPSPNREYILIHLRNGTRLYRKITGAAIFGDGERLEIDMALGLDVTPEMVKRISFLILGRLNQDTVELIHHTDTKGATTASAVFLTDPGIEGIEDQIEIAVDPIPPGEAVDPADVVYDPFRPPDGKIWFTEPSFSAAIGAGYATCHWGGRRDDEDTGFDSSMFGFDGVKVALPASGSFLVRAQVSWTTSFGVVPAGDFAWARIFFENSPLDPVEEPTLSAGTSPIGPGSELQSDRDEILPATIDLGDDLVVRIDHRGEGSGGNIHPAEPAYFIVEWWS